MTDYKMSDDRFWELVASVQWGNNCHLPAAVLKRKLIERMYTQEVLVFNAKVTEAYQHLKGIVDLSYLTDIGDDSYHDLLMHIIGLGREVYMQHCENPYQLQKRVDDGDFVESFGYVIPYPDNLEKMTTQHYTEWANRTIDNNSKVVWENIPEQHLPFVKQAYARFDRICKLVLAQEYKKAIVAGDKVYDVNKALSKLECSDAAKLDVHAGIANMIHDINIWILGNKNKAGY